MIVYGTRIMPEILDAYMQQIAPRCQDCPVLRACVEANIAWERNANGNSAALQHLLDRAPSDLPELDHLLRTGHGELLGLSTQYELETSKWVSGLTHSAEPCAGPKRGAPDVYALRYKIVDYIRNKRSCRNPALQELFKD